MQYIPPVDIAAFRDDQVKAGNSRGAANLVVKTLRIAFNLAVRQGMIPTNPTEAADLFAVGQQTRSTLTREQLGDLLKIAGQEWRGMILLCVCHGLRLGDAARLTWVNVNAERQSQAFHPQKTARGANSKPEEYPMHPGLSD